MRSGPRPDRRSGPRAAAAALSLLVSVGVVACLWTPADVAAQEPPALDVIEAAADSGYTDSARAMLNRWRAAREDGAAPEQRTRASFLRARLTRDADSAASRYLRVAVDGTPGYGDRAWLRLAQLRLAAGEPGRALQVLNRLRSDYPSTGLTARSWLWTGHARRAAGQGEEACAAWRRALGAAGPDAGEVRRGARAALEGCGSEAARADEAAAGEGAGSDSVAPQPGEPPADSAAPRSGWVVQLGAFRHRSGAEKLKRTVGERVSGVELVIVPPGPEEELFRVQTFPPGDRASARSLGDELESRQISAIVVRTRP